MLKIYERLGIQHGSPANERLVLDHEQRTRGRLRVFSSAGEEVRIFLERGKPLLVGEYLRSQCGRVLQVEGAIEPVVTALCEDPDVFSRACYHLGNRHVKVQIGNRWLRMTPDHVLEEMLTQLGLQLRHEQAVFLPESGAYHSGHHHH